MVCRYLLKFCLQFFWIYIRSRIAGLMIVFCLTFWNTGRLFSAVVVPVCILWAGNLIRLTWAVLLLAAPVEATPWHSAGTWVASSHTRPLGGEAGRPGSPGPTRGLQAGVLSEPGPSHLAASGDRFSCLTSGQERVPQGDQAGAAWPSLRSQPSSLGPSKSQAIDSKQLARPAGLKGQGLGLHFSQGSDKDTLRKSMWWHLLVLRI